MKWEYNIVISSVRMSIYRLNEIGREGWELVSVVEETCVRYIVGTKVNTTVMVYYFKRKIE